MSWSSAYCKGNVHLNPVWLSLLLLLRLVFSFPFFRCSGLAHFWHFCPSSQLLPHQNTQSAQQSAAFHRLWNHCPATAQIFNNNLLQAPTIQIWLKGLELWLKARSFLDPSGLGGKMSKFQTAFYPEKLPKSLVLGSLLFFSMKTPPARTSRTTVLRFAVSTHCGSYTRKASRTITKIILSSLRVLAPLKKDCSGSHDNTWESSLTPHKALTSNFIFLHHSRYYNLWTQFDTRLLQSMVLIPSYVCQQKPTPTASEKWMISEWRMKTPFVS